ncbi:pyridine nucleotide-disulfide oxidoreductase, partial [Streptomyces sp. MS2A]|nr:pyridine nucleotide-disulfide oxidoreductase [Streptomyces sp. MS2A]
FDGVDPAAAPNNQLKIMLRTLQSWRTREPSGAPRRLHLHFWHAPLEIVGAERVEAVRFARTAPGAEGAVATGEERTIPVQAVYRAVGYFGSPVLGAPFDERRGVVPNEGGRVDGEPGLYATGWIKRGPVGLIGHTKSDASETIANLLDDARARRLPDPTDSGDLLDDLVAREVAVTTWDGWLALDAHERALGETHEHRRERVKVIPRDEQVAISSAGALAR